VKKAIVPTLLLLGLLTAAAAGGGGGDKKPPTVPKKLTATVVSSTQIDLSWRPSSDNVRVTGYRVYRDGTQIGTAPGTSYSAIGLTPDTPYSFRVAAYDAAGNLSPQSNTAGARTQAGAAGGGPPPAGLPLLGPSDLAYQGAFLLPESSTDRTSFSYGGTALAYNPGNTSLFAVGHDWYQLTAEVTIPALVQSTNLDDLNTATFIQTFTDATNGKIDKTGGDHNKIGGQLVYGGHLYGTSYIYYDASGSQVVSHWVRPSTSLTSGTATGLFRVGSLATGMVSGYLAQIPPEWRSSLGGPALTGNCCLSIISRTSYGPAVFAFDPANLGAVSPVPDSPLVYYPSDHPDLGDWSGNWDPANGLLFNGTTQIRGVVFPTGTRSVLFFGTQGTGEFCYGEGTDDPSLTGLPTPDGSIWCYDPDGSSKGTHGYPYVAEVWAYDADDLLAVKNGEKQPWEVKPYAVWTLSLPFGSGVIGGAAYDPASGAIYVSQQYGNGTDPVIHAFKVT
jgi:hypothetical protein